MELSADELIGLVSDPQAAASDVEHALEAAVLYLAAFEPLLDGRARRPLVEADDRTLALAVLRPGEEGCLVRYPGATRLVYVLDGYVRYSEPETTRIVGVGQLLAIPAGTAHALHARDGEAVVLDVLLGDLRLVEALDVPEDEAVSDYYYEYDECYRTVYAEGAELWETPEPNDALVAFVDEPGSRLGPRVLDLGCGEGRDSVFLARRGFDVTGVDVSRAALDKARERAAAEGVDCTFLERDVILLDNVGTEPFDWAINMGCLHMLSEPDHRRRHLERVWEVLRPGGEFLVAHCRSEWLKGFFSVPHYDEIGPAVPGRVLRRRIRLPGGGIKWIELPTTHFKEATETELAEELRAAGFEPLRLLSEHNEAFGNTAVLVARKAA
jgi:SAM-dependent methyltransferase/mannose-6-phosphate isomerase-like protein (cupin superfamily)